MEVHMLRQNFLSLTKKSKSWTYNISPRTPLTVLTCLLPTVILTETLLLPDAPNLPFQPILTF